MKIIKKLRSMIIARRIQKTCKAWKNVRKLLYEDIKKSCKLTFYIKPGYKEPTYFVGVSTIDGKEYNVSILDFGIISASKIVEAVEALQFTSDIPASFAVGDTNMKAFLQDNGVDNVIVDTKEHYEAVLKSIDASSEENK